MAEDAAAASAIVEPDTMIGEDVGIGEGESESKESSPVPAPTPPPDEDDDGSDEPPPGDEEAPPSSSPKILPLPIGAVGEGGGDERPFAVVILRAFGDLPMLSAFALMCSGFLTDGKAISGASISHVQEEKIRELLGLESESLEGNTLTIGGYDPLKHTDHRLAIEDLVRILPKRGHCLLELCTLPSENVERILRILLASGRKVVLYRVMREALPDHFPRSAEDRSRIRKSGKKADVIPTSGGQVHFTHISKEKYEFIKDLNTSTIGYLRDLGAKTHDLVYNPHDKLVKIESRACELLTNDNIRVIGSQRVISDPRESLKGYLEEYPSGGSLREFKMSTPIGRDYVRPYIPKEWESTDTLLVEPMRISDGKRSINVTSHTEVVIREKEGPAPFIPLTWHYGDLRTIQLHHQPLSTSLRVL